MVRQALFKYLTTYYHIMNKLVYKRLDYVYTSFAAKIFKTIKLR